MPVGEFVRGVSADGVAFHFMDAGDGAPVMSVLVVAEVVAYSRTNAFGFCDLGVNDGLHSAPLDEVLAFF